MDAVVSALWRYPVKSMLGQALDSVRVGERGFAGDRGWAVRDERRGGIRGAKKIAGLLQLQAAYRSEPDGSIDVPHVDITLPGGARVGSDAADVNERLTSALDHPVTLWPLQPPENTEHYRRGAADHDDVVQELRSIFGRTQDEPLPDLSVFPPEIFEFESPPGTYFDAFPIHLVTTASLRRLAELGDGETPDVRRFRPNVVVDVAGSAFVEQEWVGQALCLGDVVLDVVTGCPRCVVVTHAQAGGLARDRALLRTVVRDAGQDVGVYARVRAGGQLSVGAPVTVE